MKELCYSILARYNLRLFETTEILLNAMANAARIGCSCLRNRGTISNGARTPAATGMRIIL